MDKAINEIKYYSPNLTEFRIGFQYEVINQTFKEYLKEMFNPWKHSFEYFEEWASFSHDHGKDIITYRVKYLDAEDLEFLGFKYEYKNVYRKDKYFMYIEDFVNGTGYRIKIYYAKVKDPMFVGFIKNKTDLREILKQNNIISEVFVDFTNKAHKDEFDTIIINGDSKVHIEKGVTQMVFDYNSGDVLVRVENTLETVNLDETFVAKVDKEIFETINPDKYTKENINTFTPITNAN